jgi:hypothetical protein
MLNARMRFVSRVVAVLLWLACLLDGRAEDYAIKMVTPFKAGQKFQINATASDSRMNALFSDGRILKQETETKVWELVAGIEVLAVNEQGQATNLNLQVAKLTMIEAGKTNALLDAGSVVSMAYRDGQKYFQFNGKEAPTRLNEVLASFLETGNPAAPTDDEVFGTVERKKVGDQWKANVELGVKALQRENFKIDPKNVTGTAKLEAVVEVKGVKCLRVSGVLSMPNVGVQIPNGMVARKTNVEMRVSGLFPVNGQTGRLQSSESFLLDLSAVGKTQDAHMLQLNAQAERKVERTYTY